MESIRSAMEQASRYLDENPEAGKSSDAAATAVREDGLRFRVDGPKGSLTSDMTEAVGGAGDAPSPGWILRAALAACDATLVAMEAARAGVELTHLEVSVDSDSDFRGVLGVDESVAPGPVAMRVRVELAAANADEAELRGLVERAERRSPVRDAVVRAVPLSTEMKLV